MTFRIKIVLGVMFINILVSGIILYLAGFGLGQTDNPQLVQELKLTDFLVILAVIGFSGVLSYLLGTVLTGPLNELISAADKITVPGPGLKLDVRGNDEIAHATSPFNEISSSREVSYEEMRDSVARHPDHFLARARPALRSRHHEERPIGGDVEIGDEQIDLDVFEHGKRGPSCRHVHWHQPR